MSKQPRPCPYFCCSAFRNFQGEEPESFECNLENAIHPIFAPGNFASTSEHIQSRINWELLKPALQLASRFLSMHSVRKHMLDMAYGDLYLPREAGSGDDCLSKTCRGRKAKPTDRLNEATELLCYPRPGPKASNDEIRIGAELLLLDLVDMVQFKFADTLGETREGQCNKEDGALSDDLREKFPHGVKSRILLNASILDDINSAAGDYSRHPYALRDRQFWLAETLCHELGHALTIAFYEAQYFEPFVRSRWCSESGFDMVYAIFGGIPRVQAIRSSIAYEWSYVLHEWPSDAIVRKYCLGTGRIGLRKMGTGYTKVFKFPQSLIEKCFREEFWHARETDDETSTLRPKKLPGWIVRHGATDEEILENMPRNSDTEDEDRDNEESSRIRRSTRPTKQKAEKKRDRDLRRSKAAKINFVRMIEHDEVDLPGSVVKDLRNIIRRQKVSESYGSIAINGLRRSFRIERKPHCRSSRHCEMEGSP